ncbi:DUF5994 family protein [Williamsia sterculiae]|uniref:Uncharacterized protein n=1 Tax=Williamsia sterculiae TaxID=1344003 RepID=A0A1N7G4K5_9NOCA|nr:hypothetical protein SAMN05445060_2493 [Williamsia sterculiae]
MTSLLGPPRVHLHPDLTQPVGGVWFPYTSTLSDELASFSQAVTPMLGSIVALQMDWRAFRSRPGLDSEGSPPSPPLLRVTTNRMTVEFIVIPPRTPSTLAEALARLASGKPIPPERRHSLLVRYAEQLLERASTAAEHRGTLRSTPPSRSKKLGDSAAHHQQVPAPPGTQHPSVLG